MTEIESRRSYIDYVNAIADSGRPVTSRGLPTREAFHSTMHLDDIMHAVPFGVGRKLNPRIGATEYLQLLAGVSDLIQLDAASGGNFRRFSNGGRLLGAYGPRAYQPLRLAVQQLAKDTGTRQAVVPIWRPDDLALDSRDIPCTIALNFHVRNGHLHMATHMRSNDIWLGYPYDVWMFTRLQMSIASALGLPTGVYTHHADSLHIYESDIPKLDQLHVEDEEPEAPPAITFDGPFAPGTALHRWTIITVEALRLVLGQRVVTKGTGGVDYYRPLLKPTLDAELCHDCRYINVGRCYCLQQKAATS